MATGDFLNIIQQFQTPVPQDSQVQEPKFGDHSEQAKRLQSLITTVSLGTTPSEPHPIKHEYFEAIRVASRLPKSLFLETFNPFHMECAEALINVFMKIERADLEEAIKYAKTQINLHLLNYVLSVVLRHREDAVQANIQIPSHICTTPQMYFDMNKVLEQFHSEKVKENEESKTATKKPLFIPINSNYTATDMDPEHRVAYFREDIGLNLHHRHWHEVYPFIGGKEIVNKDRRGELFYYMHQQIVARYNFERLSNNLHRAVAYDDFRTPISEAYFPKLDTETNSKLWCPRQANAILKDLHRDSFYCKISDMERWRERIFDAIDRGYAYVKNADGTETMKKLVEPEAINDLGNTIESVPALSLNSSYYGDLHNKGHLFFSYCHDPDYRFREQGSVMSHSETALRDPIFYRWHVFVDDIFQHYKRTLPPYTEKERSFPGIQIQDVQVVSEDVPEKNTFETFWQKDIADITQGILGLDPKKDGAVYAMFSHLQHKNFVYKITVNNQKTSTVTGTVRIFMAPKYDESGLRMNFNRQRRLFVELDKFTTILKPGNNLIERDSASSSVTIPFEQSFMTTSDALTYTEDEASKKALLSYCGCGLPQHLLIGKGNAAGFPCALFVMITDYETDKVDDSAMIDNKECCKKSAVSFCGVRDKKYPDKKPMGFPFDRNIKDTNAKLEDFLTKSQISPQVNGNKPFSRPTPEEPLPNMKVIYVKVKFVDKKVIGPSMLKCGFKKETTAA